MKYYKLLFITIMLTFISCDVDDVPTKNNYSVAGSMDIRSLMTKHFGNFTDGGQIIVENWTSPNYNNEYELTTNINAAYIVRLIGVVSLGGMKVNDLLIPYDSLNSVYEYNSETLDSAQFLSYTDTNTFRYDGNPYLGIPPRKIKFLSPAPFEFLKISNVHSPDGNGEDMKIEWNADTNRLSDYDASKIIIVFGGSSSYFYKTYVWDTLVKDNGSCVIPVLTAESLKNQSVWLGRYYEVDSADFYLSSYSVITNFEE